MGRTDNCSNRRTVLKTAGLTISGLLAGCTGGGNQAEFPDDDITLIVPYSTGGGYDAYTRLTAKYMPDHADVEVNVENVTGAGGQIAAEQVYDADSDGYTNIIWNSMGFARREIMEDVNYATTEMSYYAQIAEDTQGLAVRPDIGIETLDDFVEAVQNEELTFGTQGMLNDGILNPLLLGRNSGLYNQQKVIDNTVVYDGTSEIVNAMIAGDVDTVGANYYSLLPYQESGDVRILLALRTFDEVPVADQAPSAETLTTADVPNGEEIEAMTTNARVFAGPPDVSEDRIEILSDLFEQTITSDELQEEAEDMDRPIAYAGREETQEAVTNSYELWEENEDLLNELANN